jgi:hypothetical protein
MVGWLDGWMVNRVRGLQDKLLQLGQPRSEAKIEDENEND